VCRRCLVLHPLTVAVVVAGLGGALDPPTGGTGWLWWLTVPATVEYGAEALGVATYRPRRQVVLTAALALGLGWGVVAEARAPAAVPYWTVVGTQGAAALVVTVVGWRLRQRRRARDGFDAAVRAAEHRLRAT
jgi:hypothetical protein